MNMNIPKENLLGISWHDSAWIPILNPGNVLDYFSERSNIFYDRTCNNELVKMQRLGLDQLQNMTGLEYILLHVQEPVLYVIRKQHRHSPSHATALADYYIIAGRVYQAPDLGSVVNSRLLNTVNHLQSAFEECMSYTRYHPSKDYWWDFKDSSTDDKSKKDKQDETSSAFQRQRVDMLLAELAKKFPLPLRPVQFPYQHLSAIQQASSEKAVSAPASQNGDEITYKHEAKENDTSKQGPGNSDSVGPGTGITTQQKMKPPEKKPRLN